MINQIQFAKYIKNFIILWVDKIFLGIIKFTYMNEINFSWNEFGVKGESKQDSFENLCTYLLCNKLKVPVPNAYKNQKSIETEPIEVNGEYHVFQAKYFESGFKWDVIKKSFEDILETYDSIKHIWFFSNKELTNVSGTSKPTPTQNDLESKAKKEGISLTFLTNRQILELLMLGENQYLLQLYFSGSDYKGYRINSTSIKPFLFLRSKDYIELKLTPSIDKQRDIPYLNLLSNSTKVLLIKGNPGSGKSILAFRLLDMINNSAKGNIKIPILIHLKECHTTSLESIIRERLSDFKISPHNSKMIYILDGFDELPERRAENLIDYISDLETKETTSKIIITSRKSSSNLAYLITSLVSLKEYEIKDLGNQVVTKYFLERGKKDSLKRLKQQNPKILKDIKDILLLTFLYQLIDSLDDKSTIFDLFEWKIQHLLCTPNHRSNLDSLNLLIPKDKRIKDINEEISFHLYKEKKLVLSIDELHDIIKNIVDYENRLSYNDINLICSYISNLFFDLTNSNENYHFTYQHRRYQEYFLSCKLKGMWEENPKMFREMGIITDKDFFEDIFMKYLRKRYQEENDIDGVIGLNLIDLYLNNNEKYNADTDYYSESGEFIKSIASQEEKSFNKLLNNEYLDLDSKLKFNFAELDSLLSKWEGFKENDDTNDDICRLSNYYTSRCLQWGVSLWVNQKKDYAEMYFNKMEELKQKLGERNFLVGDNIRSFKFGYFQSSYSWFYYKLVIRNLDPYKFFEFVFFDQVQLLYKSNLVSKMNMEDNNVTYLLKNYIRIFLDEFSLEEILQILSNCKIEFQIYIFDVLRELAYLPLFINANEQSNKHLEILLKEYLDKYNIKTGHFYLLFFKKFYKMILSEEEINSAESTKSKLISFGANGIEYHENNRDYCLLSYSLDSYSFDSFNNDKKYFNTNDLSWGLYSAIFKKYIELIEEKINITTIYSKYTRHLRIHTNTSNSLDIFKNELSILWAHILNIPKSANKRILSLLVRGNNGINSLVFFNELQKLNPKRYQKIINEEYLLDIDKNVSPSNLEIHKSIDIQFLLSKLYSKVNNYKSVLYLGKGISNGILRHNYHKDLIVSHYLVDSFKSIVSSNCLTEEEVRKYSDSLFPMLLKVRHITDGDHTRYGTYYLIIDLIKFDTKLAEYYLNLMVESYGIEWMYNYTVRRILESKIKNAKDFEKLLKEIEKLFRPRYDINGIIDRDYFENKFAVYMHITRSDFYTDLERKKSFTLAYELVTKMNREEYNTSFYEKTFHKVRTKYLSLCEFYNKEINIKSFEELEDEDKPKQLTSEPEFVTMIKDCRNLEDLNLIYSKLNGYMEYMYLKKYSSWEILIGKTFDICNNLDPFISFLEYNSYTTIIGFTRNKKYLHKAVAACLNSNTTKTLILNYFYADSGYCGFYNMIKAYSYLDEKVVSRKLFDRYFKICELLVY